MAPLPPAWMPTHELLWVPLAGLVRSWPVRLVIEGPTTYAQTYDEHVQGLPSRWVLDAAVGTWHFDGKPGYKNEHGEVRLAKLSE